MVKNRMKKRTKEIRMGGYGCTPTKGIKIEKEHFKAHKKKNNGKIYYLNNFLLLALSRKVCVCSDGFPSNLRVIHLLYKMKKKKN